jgi:hypothetical protein
MNEKDGLVAWMNERTKDIGMATNSWYRVCEENIDGQVHLFISDVLVAKDYLMRLSQLLRNIVFS